MYTSFSVKCYSCSQEYEKVEPATTNQFRAHAPDICGFCGSSHIRVAFVMIDNPIREANNDPM